MLAKYLERFMEESVEEFFENVCKNAMEEFYRKPRFRVFGRPKSEIVAGAAPSGQIV